MCDISNLDPTAQGPARYDFSVWARAGAGTTLTVTLQDSGGSLATARRIAVKKGGWARYKATFTASRASTTGRLTVGSEAVEGHHRPGRAASHQRQLLGLQPVLRPRLLRVLPLRRGHRRHEQGRGRRRPAQAAHPGHP